MKRLLQTLFALAALVPALAGDPTFKADTNHTVIGFKASTILFDVPGAFRKYEAQISGDPKTAGGASVKLVLDARSIDTGVKQRDEHLRSDDFFDVAKFPKITFTSSKVWKDAGKVFVAGTLDMHGVKKELTLAFDPVNAMNGAGADTWAFKTSAKLNRKDFGIGTDSIGAKISLKDEVELNLLLVGFFEEAKAAAPAPAKKAPAKKKAA